MSEPGLYEAVRELLVEDGISAEEFDESMSFSLDGLRAGRVVMTDQVAMELSDFFGIPACFWLAEQSP